jgi:alkylation response protein AidB-like acyl-CoA dehydrogenase
MDYSLSDDQQALIDAVDKLLERHAGPKRARQLTGAHDDVVLDALIDAGFLDVATEPDAGPLAAALVTETASRHLAAANVGARALVAAQLLPQPPRRVALAVAGQRDPVRFGADADIVLVLDGDDVRVVEPTDAVRVESGYIYPFANLELGGGDVLAGRGPELARWWRLAIAAELSGLLAPALQMTVDYLAQREQFGKPIGALQAVQHRLAEAYVWVDATRWTALASAWHATDESAASAATYACMAARHVAFECHQLHGAISFTAEYDLHLWTMRAQALRTELGGIGGHAKATSQLRWASQGRERMEMT